MNWAKTAIITLLLSGFISTQGHSQKQARAELPSRIGIKVSYFGEFVMHPGFTIGVDYSIFQKHWMNLHWDTEIGSYFHKWNNNTMFTQSSIGVRLISPFSGFLDINAGLGYMLSSPSGDVYSVNSLGELSSNEKPFTSHFKPNFSILFGWDGYRRKNIPLIVHTGLEAYWQSNFNHSLLPHAALRIGIVYKLNK